MANFEEIIKKYVDDSGGVPADAIEKLEKAISTTVGNEFVDKARYKAKLEEIDSLKSDKQTAEDNATTAEKWKTKYDALKDDFDNYKAEQKTKEARGAKESAYTELLKQAGISEKRIPAILKVSDVDSVDLDENGSPTNSDDLMTAIKEEWSDFIQTTEVKGASTPNPPVNTGGGKMTKDEIMQIKNRDQRIRAIAENKELFEKENK